MNYSNDLDLILRTELTNLINIVRKKEMAFKPHAVDKYYEQYKKIVQKG